MDGEADRTPLVGERSRDRLPDPPGSVGRQLVAHRPVELLDGSDQAQIALLDQVEQWHAGLGVVAGDRHHEPEVAFDQLALGGLVTLVLAPGELSLFGRRQQPAVTDLPNVELEGILGRRRFFLEVVLVDLGAVLHELQLRLGGRRGERIRKRPLLHRARDIGLQEKPLDPVNPPTEGARFLFCNRRAKL